MAVYVIANNTVHDEEKYEKYPKAVSATIQQYGGKYLVRDGDAKAKGCPHKRLVIIEFESEEAARRWYESPEYSAIKHYREEAWEGWGDPVPEYVTPKD
jgi:uncharacterized protein (DUF1330 family)